MKIIELTDINKSFASGFLGKKREVLHGLSLEVEKGEVYGLLGHNGSGKTTTMKVILGLLRHEQGSVRLFGNEGATVEARQRIGYLGDGLGLYPSFNALEMLQYYGELYRMERRHLAQRRKYLVDLVGLADSACVRVKKYSKGMRQRLGIALAILNDPELLILDEPYSGLDPIGRRELRDLLMSLKRSGKTIFISSHIVPDVEAICDRVGILSNGSVRRCLELKDVVSQKSAPVEIIMTGVDHRTFDGVDRDIKVIYSNADALALRCGRRELVKRVISKVYAFGGEILEIKPLRFNLEDYLMEAMQNAVGADKIKAPEKKDEREYAHTR